MESTAAGRRRWGCISILECRTCARRQPRISRTAKLHYIIENGVQLTGMPAWGNPHTESAGESWKLVLFIRSSPATQPRQSSRNKRHRQVRHITSARRPARSATRRSTRAGRRRRWRTWCAIRATIPMPSFPTSQPTTWQSSPRIRLHSSTAASGSSAISPRSVTTIFPCRCSGTSATARGARIWFQPKVGIGGQRFIRRTTCSGPPARLRWLPLGRLQHPDQAGRGVECRL